MVTHPTYRWAEDLIGDLRDELIARRRILPAESGALCMLQVGGLVCWACVLSADPHHDAWYKGCSLRILLLLPALAWELILRFSTDPLRLITPSFSRFLLFFPTAKPGGGCGGQADANMLDHRAADFFCVPCSKTGRRMWRPS